MFASWCQENFFKYMLERYSLDHLVDYGVEPLPDTASVPNPLWSQLERQIAKERRALSVEKTDSASGGSPKTPRPNKPRHSKNAKGQLLFAIQKRQENLA